MSHGFCTLSHSAEHLIFQRVQEIWSGQESVMDGLTEGGIDGLTEGRMDRLSQFLYSPLRFAVGD